MIGRPEQGRPEKALNRVGRHFGYSSSSHGLLVKGLVRERKGLPVDLLIDTQVVARYILFRSIKRKIF